MKITDLLSIESVDLNGKVSGKQEVLEQMVDLMVKRGNISDRKVYRDTVFSREEEGTTGAVSYTHLGRGVYQEPVHPLYRGQEQCQHGQRSGCDQKKPDF